MERLTSRADVRTERSVRKGVRPRSVRRCTTPAVDQILYACGSDEHRRPPIEVQRTLIAATPGHGRPLHRTCPPLSTASGRGPHTARRIPIRPRSVGGGRIGRPVTTR
jgi:hypothetical protein